ncbi:hypothetical protein M758_6G108800 [Ceratodon purpureus]|uniref:Uncharacterized protein n=1 Tax=Ceratodon purpureus TaxID=3225 RepID=A0A8T0HHJ5_CERPU|nr:hypothetical protein KC19_6G112700 [Ceratodon purpureus]KAG0569739.1 hypothetical protein KC19_6G112700 [Ceratodon purpureus]KAG0613509.1 hypothetical protein M758_6G108800 [Ceratodon purpureus]
MGNHGETKGSARRSDDDGEKNSSQMLGVIELLKNPRNRLYLVSLVTITLFLIPFNFYVSQFSICGQFVIGILCGLFIQGVYFLYCLHRTHQRRRKSVQIAQLATLDRDQLRILLSEKLFPTWVAFIDYEKTDWLNRILAKLWPHMNQVAEDIIKETVQPILDQYAMGIIQKITLQSIRFGKKAPIITGVRFVPSVEDETVLEIKFNWQAQKDRVILSVDFPGPDYDVKLKKWHLVGTAKLTFKPLTGTVPGFGAVLVSLTEVPDFDFVLKFLGENFTTLPGVGKLIDNSIRIALMDSLIWPSRIVVPMIPGDFSFLELHPVGELEVTLIQAQIFKSARHLCKAESPFVYLFVRHTNEKTKRSQSIHNTLKPVWNAVFRIEVEDPEYQKLTLKLMHDKSVGVAECIGTAQLPIKEFKAHRKTERWCEVLECTLEPKGRHKSQRWSRVSERWSGVSERWSGVLDSDSEPSSPVQSPRDHPRGKLHLIVTWYPYTREQIREKRGHNETEEMIYKERMISGL